MEPNEVIHRFIDEDGNEAYIGSTRLGSDHKIVKSRVTQAFDGTIIFTHTVERPKLEDD